MDTLIQAAEALSVKPEKPTTTPTAPRKPKPGTAKKLSAKMAKAARRATLATKRRQEKAAKCVSSTSTLTVESPPIVVPPTVVPPTVVPPITSTELVPTTESVSTLNPATPTPPPPPPPATTSTSEKKGGRVSGTKNWILIDIVTLLDAYDKIVPTTEDEYTAVLIAMNTALQKEKRPTRNMDPMKDKFRKLWNGPPTGMSGYSDVQKRARSILDRQQAKLDISILNDVSIASDEEGEIDDDEAQLIAVLASSDGVSKKEHQQAGQVAFKLLKRAFDSTSNNNEVVPPKPKKVSMNRAVQQIVEIAGSMLVQAQQDSEVRNKFMMKMIEKL